MDTHSEGKENTFREECSLSHTIFGSKDGELAEEWTIGNPGWVFSVSEEKTKLLIQNFSILPAHLVGKGWILAPLHVFS